MSMSIFLVYRVGSNWLVAQTAKIALQLIGCFVRGLYTTSLAMKGRITRWSIVPNHRHLCYMGQIWGTDNGGIRGFRCLGDKLQDAW